MFLQTWQIVAALAVVFAFGWRLGQVQGKGQAWDEMEKEKPHDSSIL